MESGQESSSIKNQNVKAAGNVGITRKKRMRRRSFTEALREKYCQSFDDDNSCEFIHIVVHGKPRNNGSGAELAHLRNVVLDHRCVSYAGIPPEGLASLCPNVVDLDLSNNLIDSWMELQSIMTHLPQLKFINLSGNKIEKEESCIQDLKSCLPPIENLVLNSTGISWLKILQLTKHMTGLKELHVCNNDYKDFEADCEGSLNGIECLRLNNNKIRKWSEVWKLSRLPNLKNLILSGNPLEDVYFTELEQDNGNRIVQECARIANEVFQNVWKEAESQKNKGASSQKLTNQKHQEMTSDAKVASLNCQRTVSDILFEACGQAEVDCSLRGSDSNVKCGDVGMAPDIKDCNFNHETSEIGCMCEEDSGRNEETNKRNEEAEADQTRHQGNGENQDIIDCCDCKMQCDTNSRLLYLENTCLSPSPSSGIEVKGCHYKHEKDRKPFQQLHTLCLSETKVSDWRHMQALSQFPRLQALRIMGISLLSGMDAGDRRKLFLASLPNIEILNGSEVSQTEREKAERYFLRHFVEKTESERPQRFTELENKHGRLNPIVDIDLGARFQEWANLSFMFCGQLEFQEKIWVVEPVGKLRTFVAERLALPRKSFRLFHVSCSPHHGEIEAETEELFLDSLPLSRFDVLSGDEIHVILY